MGYVIEKLKLFTLSGFIPLKSERARLCNFRESFWVLPCEMRIFTKKFPLTEVILHIHLFLFKPHI